MTPEELGYTEDVYGYYKYGANRHIIIEIQHSYWNGNVWTGDVNCLDTFYEQKEIDNLQIAYNNLQRDLKELNNENNVTK